MAELSIDRSVKLCSERAAGMSASEVRALFAVTSRPEIVSFAGGMPYVQALPAEGRDETDEARAVFILEHGLPHVTSTFGGSVHRVH
jgi:hypothetical protein